MFGWGVCEVGKYYTDRNEREMWIRWRICNQTIPYVSLHKGSKSGPQVKREREPYDRRPLYMQANRQYGHCHVPIE